MKVTRVLTFTVVLLAGLLTNEGVSPQAHAELSSGSSSGDYTATPTPDDTHPGDPGGSDTDQGRQDDTHQSDAPRITHNASDWAWLKTAGVLTPGAEIVNERLNSACSVGWITEQYDKGGLKIVFIYSAGHCGTQGDRISVVGKNGQRTYVGTVCRSDLEQQYGKADLSLICVNNHRIPIYGSPFSFPVQPMMRPEDAEYFLIKHPDAKICHIGAFSGISCGPHDSWLYKDGGFSFRGVSAPGDSGGPVFIYAPSVDQKIRPLGVFDGADSKDKSLLLGTVSYMINDALRGNLYKNPISPATNRTSAQ